MENNNLNGNNTTNDVIEQLITEPINQVQTNNVQDYNLQNNENKNKGRKFWILLLIIVVAVVVGVLFYLNRDFNNDSDGDDNLVENPNDEGNNKILWNGIYENGEDVVYVYQLSENEISFDANINEGYISGTAKIKGNVASGEIFETYTLELKNKKLVFSSSDSEIESAVYTRVKDYSKDDYYKNNYGDPKYLESEFNGVFEKDSTTITIYQLEEDRVEMVIVDGISYYSTALEIKDDQLFHESEFFDEISKINAYIEDGKLNLTSSSTDKSDVLNRISGVYSKVKDYTMDDIINNDN